VSETYWANGSVNSLNAHLSGLPTWTFTPEGEGRINSVTASAGQSPLLSTTAYSAFGPTALTFGSLDSDNFSYDPNTGRMTQYKFNVNGSSEVGTLGWNANGTLKQLAITDPFTASNTQVCTNTYDDLVRLLSNNCGSGWSQAYAYDPFGNLSKTGTISFQPTYNTATNRYQTLPAATAAYDANGFLNGDEFHSYSYDAEGRNTLIDSGTVTMTYDALGRWVERSAGGSYTQAVYSADGQELALTSGQAVSTAYVRLPGGAMARYLSSGLDTYWHPDWLGTTRLYSSPTRTVVNDVAYAPFGERYVGNLSDSFFTGVAQGVEASDFRYFPARNYHMTEGRWLTPDPAGLSAVDLTNPQTWNRYAYVLNNPLANVDPTGMGTITPTLPPPKPCSGPAASYNPFCVEGPWDHGSNLALSDLDPFRLLDNGLSNEGTLITNVPSFDAAALLGLTGGNATSPNTGNCSSDALGSAIGFAATGTIYSVSATTSAPASYLREEIGAAFGPPGMAIGKAVGNLFGVGGNISYVPSTGSLYAGPAYSFGVTGGGGLSANAVHVPTSQNPNSIANGWSTSITYQQSPFAGSTVTKSSGSPPVVGPSFGSKSPFSVSTGYNFCLRHCGC
jgi:RHS repeat-associated protein